MTDRRPSLAELRAVAQPPEVLGRVSGEHWAGKLYMRHASIRLTRLVAPTSVTPDGLTWTMIVAGVGAALVLTVPHWWSALLAMLLIQVQLLVDCSDGELARWRRRNGSPETGARGIYLDRLGHYVTDAGLAIAVGVHADGGLGSAHRWTTLGLCTGVLVLVTKAETDLVQAARASAGLPPARDDVATATPQVSLLRRLRRIVARFPFNRALLAFEMTVLATVAGAVSAGAGTDLGMKVLAGTLLGIAGFVTLAHLASVLASGRLR
jgi:phosphatidylglycerophosphate synthase